MVPGEFPILLLRLSVFFIRGAMQNRTDTLEVGSRAPAFALSAANREGTFSLPSLVSEGRIILEFLRGTW